MLDKGIKTEVDHINGYVVEKARELGEKVPHHEAIVEAIHKVERGELKREIESLPNV